MERLYNIFCIIIIKLGFAEKVFSLGLGVRSQEEGGRRKRIVEQLVLGFTRLFLVTKQRF